MTKQKLTYPGDTDCDPLTDAHFFHPHKCHGNPEKYIKFRGYPEKYIKFWGFYLSIPRQASSFTSFPRRPLGGVQLSLPS